MFWWKMVSESDFLKSLYFKNITLQNHRHSPLSALFPVPLHAAKIHFFTIYNTAGFKVQSSRFKVQSSRFHPSQKLRSNPLNLLNLLNPLNPLNLIRQYVKERAGQRCPTLSVPSARNAPGSASSPPTSTPRSLSYLPSATIRAAVHSSPGRNPTALPSS